MSPRCTCHERVRGVDRAPSFLERRLVVAGSPRRLAGRLEETKPVEQPGESFPFLRPDAPVDLGDVDAARPKRVPIDQETK